MPASSSSRNAASATPIADARHSGFTPIFCSRDGGCRILSAHFGAAAPSSNDAVPSGNVTLSVPPRAATFDICLNGIDSFRSPPRNCSTSVSSRAFPAAVRPLNRAVTRSLHFPCRVSFNSAARRRRCRKPFDRVAQRRARNRGAVGAEIALEARHVGLAGLAQRPADRFLNQILAVRVQAPRDAVDEIERLAAAGLLNQADDRRARTHMLRSPDQARSARSAADAAAARTDQQPQISRRSSPSSRSGCRPASVSTPRSRRGVKSRR